MSKSEIIGYQQDGPMDQWGAKLQMQSADAASEEGDMPLVGTGSLVGGRWYTCYRHGWDCRGTPCPKCTGGDAPRHCAQHGWSHTWKPCPKCTAGK